MIRRRELAALCCVIGATTACIAAPPSGPECDFPGPCVPARATSPAQKTDQAKSWNNRAIELIGAGDLRLALDYLSKAIELDPKLPDALINRGVVYQRLNSYDLAMADFGRALALPDPPSFSSRLRAPTLERLAETHLLKLDFDAAQMRLGEALTLFPGSSRGYASRALALLGSGRNLQALEDVSRASWISPASTYVQAVKDHVAAGGAVDQPILTSLLSLLYIDRSLQSEPPRTTGAPATMPAYASEILHTLQAYNSSRRDCGVDNWYSLQLKIVERRLSVAVDFFQHTGAVAFVDDPALLLVTSPIMNCQFIFAIARNDARDAGHVTVTSSTWQLESSGGISSLRPKVESLLNEDCEDMEVIFRSYSGIVDHRTTFSVTGLPASLAVPAYPGERIKMLLGGKNCGITASVFTSTE